MESEDYRQPTEHFKLNHFAIRCFRDTGDDDYIAARLAMRARLPGPFLWSAEQAIEKYLKCILFLNRRDTDRLNHNIRAAFDRINSSLPFKIALNKGEQSVFDHIADWNADRYLLRSFVLRNSELLQLDALVWKLRQYCQPLDIKHWADPPCKSVLMEKVQRITDNLDGDAASGYLHGGRLEKILHDKKSPAHGALVWMNMQYSLKKRNSVQFRNGTLAVNTPLWVAPELAQDAAKLMKIPEYIVDAANVLAKERDRKKRDKARATETK